MSAESAAQSAPVPSEQVKSEDPPPLGRVRGIGPPRQVIMPSGEVGYVVTRNDDAQRALTHPAFSRGALFRPGAPPFALASSVGTADSLLNMDPPEHTQVRIVVSKAFTRRRVAGMRGGIQEVTDDLLDRMADAGPPVDLVGALCAPLPVTVICQLLGVPYEDRASFRAWTSAAMTVTGYSPEQAAQALQNLSDYLAGLIAKRRTEPADDLLSALVAARDQEERLTEPQLVNLGMLLLIAGHETTLYQLGRSVHALLRRPQLYASLHADPNRVPSAVEELLRLRSSVPGAAPRLTTQDAEIGGVRIPAGSIVMLKLSNANRDPHIIRDPEEMDFNRPDNKHLAFGHGPHFCLGAALARAELQVALAALVRRFPSLRFAVDPATIPWQTGQITEGPMTLPVTW